MGKNKLSKRKVLHGVYSFKMGGAEKIVSYYARYHDRSRFEPIICSLTSGGELEEEIKKFNVKTFMFNKQKIFPLLFRKRRYFINDFSHNILQKTN